MKIICIGSYVFTMALMLHCLGAGAQSASLNGNFTYPGDHKNGYSGYTITLERSWHPKTIGSPEFFDAQGDHFNVSCLIKPNPAMVASANSLFLTAKTAATRGKRVTFTPLHLGKYSGGIVIHQLKHVQLPIFPPT